MPVTARLRAKSRHGYRMWLFLLPILWARPAPEPPQTVSTVPVVERFAVHDVSLESMGQYANPYKEVVAEAVVRGPAGASRTLPLFWDGGSTWKLRFSPETIGDWQWSVRSSDPGLNGRTGRFRATGSERKGSIRSMRDSPRHFERQDGSRFWFLGDTAWALFTDNEAERHDRAAAFRYLDARAGQGFNVIHSMLLSEAGWENRGGPPFTDLAREIINPKYWQEVDVRLAQANSKGLVCGLVIGWGDKRREEPYAWGRFSDVQARKRYARYAAARYSAYDVYFIVAGEWHAEVRTRPATEADLKREFIEIGEVLDAADPHERMIGIHPMIDHGSVREFADASWMDFGDYQQNYRDLHARVLESRRVGKPVVNAEYGYFLRDQNGDGVPDKDNSTSADAMRHATWDIVMAGGYIVTGFGTTYFGGNRDPGPFDVAAARNTVWGQQVAVVKRIFEGVPWWTLQPGDSLVTSATPRGADGKEIGRVRPPHVAYWALSDHDRQYVLYVRGLRTPATLTLSGAQTEYAVLQVDPRTGAAVALAPTRGGRFVYQPPDEQDWAVVLTMKLGTHASRRPPGSEF